MSPWLVVFAVFACLVFPPLLPLAVIVLAWYWTDGGERPALWLERRARERFRETYLAGLTYGPVPLDGQESSDEGVFGACLSCGEPTTYDPRRDRWTHILPNDSCWEPLVPRQKEEPDA